MSLAEELKRLEKELNIGGNKYKFIEGANKLRILVAPIPHTSVYMGNRSVKFITHIVDRKDGKVKLAFLPYTIYKGIVALSEDDDYAFQDFPMPYDINVNAKNAGTKDVEYTIIASRQNTELTAEELIELKKQKSLEDIREKLKARQPDIDEPAHDEGIDE